MEQNREKLDQILRELHFADPSIDINDEKLKEIVSKMLQYKPEFENKSFKAELKREINREIAFQKKKHFDFGIFKKIAYFGSGAVFSYAVFSVTNPISEDILNTKKPSLNPPIAIKSDKEENTSKESTKTENIEKKILNKENKTSENNIGKNTIQTKNEIKKNGVSDKTSTNTPVKESLKITKSDNSDISENNTENTGKTNGGLMENSLTYMRKSLPDNSTSLEDVSNYTDSIAQDTGSISNDTNISNDLLGGTNAGLMAMPIKKEFVSENFIKDLETNTTNLAYSLRTSELKIENDTLIITTSTQTDFDIINTTENLRVIKSYLEKSGFYYEIKVNLK
ncbi:MAG: hypothetical protein PHR68_03900 [Candidatus Gracilibacteria bacterium]|nr:hypothetical protein [Candidatus Gracilibacteria bacterium]